jgi:hypothetical protein
MALAVEGLQASEVISVHERARPSHGEFSECVLFINETLLYRFPFEDSFGQGKVAQAGGSRDKIYCAYSAEWVMFAYDAHC